MGQNIIDYQINNAGHIIFNTGTYTGTVTSAAGEDNFSAGTLNTNGAVNLSGSYSGYYGSIINNDGSTLTLGATTDAIYGSKFAIGDASYGSTTKLIIGGNGATFSGSTSNAATNMVTMDKYGILDVVKPLTISKGNLLMSNYDAVTAPVIKFYPAATTPKITFSESGKLIKTDETSSRIDASKNLTFDMTNAPTTTVGENTFIIAQFNGVEPSILNGPSPNVTGNSGNMWVSSIVENDITNHRLLFKSTFAPLFNLESDGSTYKGLFSDLNSRTSSSYQKFLKDYTVTSDYNVNSDLFINLQAFNLTGNQTFTIGSGKTLGLKGTGNFTNVVNFGSAESQLQLVGVFTSDQMPSVAAGSAASGSIVVGDGSVTSSLTIDATLNTNFNGKVSKIVVNNGATVTVTP